MVKERLHLLCGPESFLQKNHLDQLLHSILPSKSERDINTHRFDLATQSLSDILTQAQTLPFLSEQQVLILSELSELEEEGRAQLLQAIASSPAATVWVLLLPEGNAKAGWLKSLSAQTKFYNCETPATVNDCIVWMRAYCKNNTLIPDSNALVYLVEKLGKNLSLLSHALDQVQLLIHPKKDFKVDDVAQLVGGIAEQNIFEMYQALKEGRAAKAFEILSRLRQDGQRSYEIIASLVWQFDRYLKIKNMLALGASPGEIASQIRIPPFVLNKLIGQVKRMSKEEIQSDMKALIKAERAVKRSLLREDLALDECLLSLNSLKALSQS